LKPVNQQPELANAVSRQDKRRVIALLRIKECGASGREIAAAPVRQREQQMDLSLNVVPAMHG
jgi:hypothetical protein